MAIDEMDKTYGDLHRELDNNEKNRIRTRKIVFTALWLTLWYNVIPPVDKTTPANIKYPIPLELVVQDAVYTTTGKVDVIIHHPEWINIKLWNVDFSKPFSIKTPRYTISHRGDFKVSQMIGYVLSTPQKLFFWDSNVSYGLDTQRIQAVIWMLEKNPEIKDLTVRLSHNMALQDWYRMMFDPEIREKSPFLYRLIIGSLTTIKHEIIAEFLRWDYYNPITKTAVLYSNVESISAHEIGHHIDFSQFSNNTRWMYDLSRIFPPAMLWQEWQASANAKWILLSKEDEEQFYRYLVPAFFTYILWSIALMLKYYQKLKSMGKRDDEVPA